MLVPIGLWKRKDHSQELIRNLVPLLVLTDPAWIGSESSHPKIHSIHVLWNICAELFTLKSSYQPGDSKWPLDSLFWGHQQPFKVSRFHSPSQKTCKSSRSQNFSRNPRLFHAGIWDLPHRTVQVSRTFLTAGAAAGTATWQSQGRFDVDVVGLMGIECSRSHRNLGWWFSKIFYFHPFIWGNDPIWRLHIFQMGWLNHQLSRKLGVGFSVKLDTAWDDIGYTQIFFPLQLCEFVTFGIQWPGGWPTLTSNGDQVGARAVIEMKRFFQVDHFSRHAPTKMVHSSPTWISEFPSPTSKKNTHKLFSLCTASTLTPEEKPKPNMISWRCLS